MVRRVEECPHRGHVQGGGNAERADCRLLRTIVEGDGPSFQVRRDACERCCRFSPPSLEPINPVIASLLYQLTNQAVATSGASGRALGKAMAIRERAIGALETISAVSRRAESPDAAPPMQPLRKLADRDITVDCFSDHIVRREPFSYFRYGDVEWLSMFGDQGKNSGRHDFMPETVGCELRDSIDYVASLTPDNQNLYVGLPLSWRPDRILTYLKNRDLVGKVHWVDASLFPLGLRDLSTKRFLEAVRDFRGPKYLVANRWLAPVAKGARHGARQDSREQLLSRHRPCRAGLSIPRAGAGSVLCLDALRMPDVPIASPQSAGELHRLRPCSRRHRMAADQGLHQAQLRRNPGVPQRTLRSDVSKKMTSRGRRVPDGAHA